MEDPADLRRVCHADVASEGCIVNASLSKWDVCRGRRNVSFWLEFISDFYSRYHIEKNRLLKKEIVKEAVCKWTASGGRFLSKRSDGFCVLSDSTDQLSVAAHYFRNYRSMGLSRRQKPAHAVPPTSPSTPPSGKLLSLEKSPTAPLVVSPSPPPAAEEA